MIDKKKLEDDMKIAYDNMTKCRDQKGIQSCDLCKAYDIRYCFDYHFYMANFELSQLISDYED